MIFMTAKLHKKKVILFTLSAGLVAAGIIFCFSRGSKEKVSAPPQLSDNAQRVTYLQSLGWQVNPEPVEALQFLLPDTLEEPYIRYNALQLSQGLDLSVACGKAVSRYTYTVLNYPERPTGVQANLYLCEDIPVAGDIFCTGANGFQTTLLFPDTHS